MKKLLSIVGVGAAYTATSIATLAMMLISGLIRIAATAVVWAILSFISSWLYSIGWWPVAFIIRILELVSLVYLLVTILAFILSFVIGIIGLVSAAVSEARKP